MKPLLKIASIILSLLWKKPFLNDYLNHSFFTLNSHDTSLYFCYTHHIPPCLICSLFLLSCKLLENMDNLLHNFFSFFFSYQPLYKVLHRECNWYSLKCLQWRNKRMNKWIAIRKAFVLDTLFALHPSPLCSGHWEIKLCWLHQPLFPSGFQLAWPMRSTTRNMKVREKKRRSIYPPFSLWASCGLATAAFLPISPQLLTGIWWPLPSFGLSSQRVVVLEASLSLVDPHSVPLWNSLQSPVLSVLSMTYIQTTTYKMPLENDLAHIRNYSFW